MTLFGEKIRLTAKIGQGELERVLARISDGSLYAYRDSIAEGYITADGGIRVGVSGIARYDGGRLVGISEISSLVFRIPTSSSEVAEELFSAWRSSQRGMLISSPPGIGKTTALRSLIGLISTRLNREIAVIDERFEFRLSDYKNMSVDILQGYKRSLGMQIALRTLSPDVIVIDEIGREEESLELLDSTSSGVRILASAHADSLSGLMRRKSVEPLIKCGVFDVFVMLSAEDGRRVVKTEVFSY